METLWQDLRYGARQLLRSPGFTAVAVLTLALGIGANTAIFSVVNAVLLRPLPYDDPEHLVRFRQNQSWPDMSDLTELSQTIAGFGGYTKVDLDFTGGPEAERVNGTAVTGSLFPLLGAEAARGRIFQPKEDQPGGDHLVVLSHSFWQTHLRGDSEVVGRSVSFSGSNYTVVGVMPPNFQLPQDKADVWVLLRVELWEAAQHRGVHFLRGFGRLKPGVTLEQVQADLDNIARRLAAQYPEENTDIRFLAIPLHDYTVRSVRTALLVLLGAVALVLFIACANVANLLLTRNTARQREIAIRMALGSGRLRLTRQLLTEGLLLALAGGSAGLLLASWLLDLVLALSAEAVPRIGDVGLDTTVLVFSAGLSLLTVALFGLVPAMRFSRPNLQEALKEAGRGAGGLAHRRLRNSLVVAEVALAFVLLTGAGLLLHSLYQLQSVDAGFEPARLLTANITLPAKTYRDIPRRVAFYEQVVERVEALPGVVAVGGTTDLPFASNYVDHDFVIEGRPPLPPGTEPDAYYRGVTPNYFRAMRIPLLRGRVFTDADRDGAPLVVIINERMARDFFLGEDPLGQRIHWARVPVPYSMTIVGVVGNVRSFGFEEEDLPAAYVPFRQEKHWWRTWMNLTVRTSGDPAALVGPIRAAVAEVNSNIPVADVQPMEERMGTSLAGRHFNLFLLGLFALLALGLAAVGIYGIVSYVTAQRTHEIGIRMALGAQRRNVLKLIVGQGLRLALAGVALGVAGSLGLMRLLSTLLFGVTPTDPLTLIGVTLVLTGVALLACWIPARRAARVDPMVALRYE